jgi:hypothetical protein
MFFSRGPLSSNSMLKMYVLFRIVNRFQCTVPDHTIGEDKQKQIQPRPLADAPRQRTARFQDARGRNLRVGSRADWVPEKEHNMY